VAATAAAKRRGASTTKIAAKERRQKVFVVVLSVILAVVLVFEVPKMLNKSGSTSATSVPSTPSTSAPEHPGKRISGSGNGADPFAVKATGNGDGVVAGDGGRPDPFTPPAKASAATAPVAPAALPRQIVIGRPGGDRVATHGWIVILASIPTGSGHGDAVSFARSAGRNVGRLSILNSSHSRPLRGGYWVVYSGPYGSLGRVTQVAGNIHAAGYRTAYIRQLIAYK